MGTYCLTVLEAINPNRLCQQGGREGGPEEPEGSARRIHHPAHTCGLYLFPFSSLIFSPCMSLCQGFPSPTVLGPSLENSFNLTCSKKYSSQLKYQGEESHEIRIERSS